MIPVRQWCVTVEMQMFPHPHLTTPAVIYHHT